MWLTFWDERLSDLNLLFSSMQEFKNKKLLLLGHGSSKHSDSSKSVRKHAEEVRRQNIFLEVHTAFLKEDMLVENALDEIGDEDVIIVLDFLAEGYFTKQVIPKLLKLATRPETIYFSQPVGLNPVMANLLATAAENELREWQVEETSLLLVGHGSTKNSRSKLTMLEHMKRLKELTGFADIGDLWLEEAPFVPEWSKLASKKQVIVVPFLLSDGQHGGWDIPEELGIKKGDAVHGVTHLLQGRELRMAPAIGAMPDFNQVIIPAAQSARKLAPIDKRHSCVFDQPCSPEQIALCTLHGCPNKN